MRAPYLRTRCFRARIGGVKSLVFSLLALASSLAWSPREVCAPVRVEDPPIECPLCGGNAGVHALIVATLTSTNARVGLRALSAFFG